MNKQLFSKSLVALFFLSLMTACEGDEEPYPKGCRMVLSEFHMTTLDDASDLGFSGEDLVALLESAGTGDFTWQSGDTTTLTVEITPSDIVEVWSPPPYEGYCEPMLEIQGAEFSFSTADGRLDETLIGDLIGYGYDGAINFIFTGYLGKDAEDAQSLDFPDEWSSPDWATERFQFDFRVQANSDASPYCRTSESESDDPNERCNVYDGWITYWGQSADDFESASYKSVNHALGWWTWSNKQ